MELNNLMDLINKTLCGDCLELLPQVPTRSVDMVLCDLPYGTTQNRWDSVIPFDGLWAEYRRILNRGGVIVLDELAEPLRDDHSIMLHITLYKLSVH